MKYTSLLLATLVAGAIVCPKESVGASITEVCLFNSAGDGCVFDVTITASGPSAVDTRTEAEGDIWRATVAQRNTSKVSSNVGTGSATQFTGQVQGNVAKNTKLVVIITYEQPLPGTFPTSVEVRFTGAATISRRISSGGAVVKDAVGNILGAFAPLNPFRDGLTPNVLIDAGTVFLLVALEGPSDALVFSPVPPADSFDYATTDCTGPQVVRVEAQDTITPGGVDGTLLYPHTAPTGPSALPRSAVHVDLTFTDINSCRTDRHLETLVGFVPPHSCCYSYDAPDTSQQYVTVNPLRDLSGFTPPFHVE